MVPWPSVPLHDLVSPPASPGPPPRSPAPAAGSAGCTRPAAAASGGAGSSAGRGRAPRARHPPRPLCWSPHQGTLSCHQHCAPGQRPLQIQADRPGLHRLPTGCSQAEAPAPGGWLPALAPTRPCAARRTAGPRTAGAADAGSAATGWPLHVHCHSTGRAGPACREVRQAVRGSRSLQGTPTSISAACQELTRQGGADKT